MLLKYPVFLRIQPPALICLSHVHDVPVLVPLVTLEEDIRATREPLRTGEVSLHPARGRPAAAPELSSRAARPARLLAHGLAFAARRPAAPPRGVARRTRTLRAPRASAAPLPPHRQDQD